MELEIGLMLEIAGCVVISTSARISLAERYREMFLVGR